MPAITNADYDRFIQAKNATQPCEACGGSKFAVWDEVNQNSRSVLPAPKFPDFDIMGADAMEVLATSCESCGAIRLYNRKPVCDWLAANPKP